MILRIKFISVTIVTFFISAGLVAQTKQTSVARLKGKMINFSSTVEIENFSEIQRMVPKTYNIVIQPDIDSLFNVTIPIKQPGYYRIGRNKLYLTPGDDMDAFLDDANPKNATFKGRGSIVNNYLINTPFPKSGSYLESGKYILETPTEMLTFILNKRNERDKELMSLNGVSAEFIRLEKARNKADVIKSIEATASYANIKLANRSKEYRDNYIKEFEKISSPVKDSLSKDFIDPSLLQIEVYRDLCNMLVKSNNVKNPKTQAMMDWEKANSLASNQIKPINDKSKLPEIKLSVDSLKTKKYRDVLYQLIAEKMKFGVGDTAIDFIVNTNNGGKTSLSSLKGKVIYLDLWATWCGPCMAEMPNFEKLKEQYENNSDIALISLSIDDNDDIWLKDLKRRNPSGIQWRIDRAKLAEYDIQSIPRYILIDKNFKITDLNAPKASDTQLASKLNKMLESK